MITMLDLEQLAEEMGVMIVTHTGGKKGGWNPATRTVSLREGMHEVQTLCTLAHELGHAHYRHQLGATGLAREQQEREANEWAAILLIDENDYMAAEINCDSISSIAHELGVTILMVRIEVSLVFWTGVFLSPGRRIRVTGKETGPGPGGYG